MGMFDTITCDPSLLFPIPEGLTVLPSSYQTKDFHCVLDTYDLRADGSLWLWVRPQVEPGSEDAKIFGEPRWVPATTILGHIWFYNSLGEHRTGWIEWKATIVDGQLRGPVKLAEYRPPHSEEEAERAEHMRKLRESWGQDKP